MNKLIGGVLFSIGALFLLRNANTLLQDSIATITKLWPLALLVIGVKLFRKRD